MKIIHLNLERDWRGGERQVFLLVRELASRGARQTVIGREGFPLLERLRKITGVALVGARGRSGAFFRLRGVPRPAIIHAHSAGVLPLAVLARRPGDAVVATRRLDLPATPFWLNRADRVVAISRSVEESLERAGVEARRVVRIPSGIDRSRRLDPGMRLLLRGKLGIPSQAPLGLTVASLEPQKDPLTLARAFRHLPPDYHHVWVGEGGMRHEVERRALEEGAGGRLHLPGFDPDADRWFGAADLFVHPSLHEGLGTALLDAFHFGLPVAGSRIRGTSEFLEEGETALLFPPGDAQGLASAVAGLLRDPSLRARLAAGGELAVSRYDIRDTAEAYLGLYRSLGAGDPEGQRD